MKVLKELRTYSAHHYISTSNSVWHRNCKTELWNHKISCKMKGNFNEIINDAKPVLIDFHALWCGPCKVQSPILKEVASEMGDKIKVIKIDVDQNPELANQYQIQGVPTLMIFQNGQIKYRQAGLHSKQQVMQVLQSIQ
jgi:thioredoxin 1